MNGYKIERTAENFCCASLLSSNAWNGANVAELSHSRPESSPEAPSASVRMLYNSKGLFGRFQVRGEYVRCAAEKFQDPVCLDSCVEFFVEPAGNRGYINFEFSGSGVFLCSHITDCKRTPNGFAAFEMLSPDDASNIVSAPTLPRKTDGFGMPVDWELGFFIPFTVFEKRGFKAPGSGDVWRANFYKCGDKTPFPHWLAWRPVDELNFHLPRCFGEIIFA
ncbi:MAG: carbohydrate-binding family 9-like protein [Victivallaceae bacterium]|nr:carbohydrate-binding family 9-like protein [Victivallaceae bacterium]